MTVDMPGIENGLDGTLGNETLTTPYGDFRNDFPTPGVDQPSETFRINYKVIQEAIENLQGRTITITGSASSSPVEIGSGTGNIDIPVSLSGSFLPTDGTGQMSGDLILGGAGGSGPSGVGILTTDTDLDLVLEPNGVGQLVLQGLVWPNADGTTGQALITDGSGNLDWGTFLTQIQEDTSPILGGDLDTNGFQILGSPDIDLVTTAPGRVRISGSGPGPADGVISAGDPVALNQPGGILTVQGGVGTGTGLGGDLVLGNAPGGNPLDNSIKGRLLIGFRNPNPLTADYAIWPDSDGTLNQVLATDGAGNLFWLTGGGGGGGITTVSSNDPIDVVSPTGPVTTLNFTIDSLTEKLAPTGTDWVIIQEAVGGAFRKAQTQNLPGSGGAGGATGLLQRALVYQNAPFPIPSGTPTNVVWQFIAAETPGPNQWFNAFVPTRLTVPAGITQVRLQSGIRMASAFSGTIQVTVLKNGTPLAPATIGVPATSKDPRQAGVEHTLSISSPTIDVTPGDYFEIQITQTSGSPINLLAENSFFAMEESVAGAQVLDDLNDVSVGNPPTALEDGYVLTWDDVGGEFILSAPTAPAAGTDTQIQYNNTGVFAGDTGFTTDGAGSVDIVGDLDVDNLNLNGNTLSSTDPNGDINIVPTGTGEVIVSSTLEAAGIRFSDVGSDTTKWVLEENASNNLIFTYLSEVFRIESTGNLNISGPITTDVGNNIELIPGTGGLVTAFVGYDMSTGTNEAFATKGYVDGVEIGDLSNVTITAPLTGDLIQFNGTNWANATLSIGHGTANSIDDHIDVDTTSVLPNFGAFLTWDGVNSWDTNNVVHYEDSGIEQSFFVTNSVNSTLQGFIKTNAGSNSTVDIQAGVNDPTDDARLILQRFDGSLSNAANVAFIIRTEQFSREVKLEVQNPNTGFTPIKTITIDADNAGIDMDGLVMSNVAIESGGPTDRPASPVVGQMFFDTLVGLPIWFNGIHWIDASGSIV